MATCIAINGFDRMGRRVFRSGWGGPGLEFAHIHKRVADGTIAGEASSRAARPQGNPSHPQRWEIRADRLDGWP